MGNCDKVLTARELAKRLRIARNSAREPELIQENYLKHESV